MERAGHAAWCARGAKVQAEGWFGRYVEVEGELIHLVEGGSGPPLILLHGFLAWSYTWRRNLPALAQVARVLAPDLRGFGLSERSRQRSHSLDSQVELVRAFMAAVGIDSAVLCGHSMGGEIALRLAHRYPEKVEALILDAASGYVMRRQPTLEAFALKLPGVGSLALRTLVLNERFASRSLRAGYHTGDRVTDAEISAYLLPARVPGSAGVLAKMLGELDFGQTAARFPEVEHEALLIWGENDPWIPIAHGRRLAEALPHGRLVTFEACGHLPHEEHPDRFNGEVIAFLDEQKDRKGPA